MNNSPAKRRIPLELFPAQLTPSLFNRLVEVLRTCRWRSLVMLTPKGSYAGQPEQV